jgi:hypothetical protein
METKTFLKSVLGDEGFYCVFAYRPKDNRRIQKFYSSIDAVVDTATQLDADGFDVYFALATFEDGNSRKVNNVKQLKSLFLDLDCGPSKDFATQKDAINALRAFCKEYSLPRPTMINSGRGVHVYWPLTETVGYANWFPVAERLKLACAEKGFMADPAVTSDAARVLRVPKTHNFKTEPPAEVCPFGVEPITPVDFDQFAEKIGGFVIPVLGNQIIYKDRIEFNPPSTQTVGLFPAFVPKGTLGGWKETMNWYNREGFELHQFVIGTAFGSC